MGRIQNESVFEILLKKRAVKRVQDPGTPGFYSLIFLVPKKKKKKKITTKKKKKKNKQKKKTKTKKNNNGKLRLIIDLSLLNRCIEKQSFKMETVKSVRQSMKHNDWAVSINLTDAYLIVPIHLQSRKYLLFVYERQVFHFTALPFGMSLRFSRN